MQNVQEWIAAGAPTNLKKGHECVSFHVDWSKWPLPRAKSAKKGKLVTCLKCRIVRAAIGASRLLAGSYCSSAFLVFRRGALSVLSLCLAGWPLVLLGCKGLMAGLWPGSSWMIEASLRLLLKVCCLRSMLGSLSLLLLVCGKVPKRFSLLALLPKVLINSWLLTILRVVSLLILLSWVALLPSVFLVCLPRRLIVLRVPDVPLSWLVCFGWALSTGLLLLTSLFMVGCGWVSRLPTKVSVWSEWSCVRSCQRVMTAANKFLRAMLFGGLLHPQCVIGSGLLRLVHKMRGGGAALEVNPRKGSLLRNLQRWFDQIGVVSLGPWKWTAGHRQTLIDLNHMDGFDLAVHRLREAWRLHQ